MCQSVYFKIFKLEDTRRVDMYRQYLAMLARNKAAAREEHAPAPAGQSGYKCSAPGRPAR